MCIIILNKSEVLTKQELKNCFENNNHGAGIAYSQNKKLRIFKSMDFQEIYDKYISVRKSNNLPVLLHFRISTQGTKDLNNVHPFFINKNLCFAHNGVLASYSSRRETLLSDTQLFNNDILRNLPKNFLSIYAIRKLITEFLGNTNKLVFLDSLGNYNIFNESLGHWQNNDTWFSNYSNLAKREYLYKDIYYSGMSTTKELCQYCGTSLFTKKEVDRKICYACYKDLWDNKKVKSEDKKLSITQAIELLNKKKKEHISKSSSFVNVSGTVEEVKKDEDLPF